MKIIEKESSPQNSFDSNLQLNQSLGNGYQISPQSFDSHNNNQMRSTEVPMIIERKVSFDADDNEGYGCDAQLLDRYIAERRETVQNQKKRRLSTNTLSSSEDTQFGEPEDRETFIFGQEQLDIEDVAQYVAEI